MDPRLQVKDFRFFLAVAQELHFRRAAERLHIAQPHLSLHIRELEDRLGVRLLDRTTRAVKLTQAGTKFLERAQCVLAQIEEAARSTRRVAEKSEGELRIGYTPAAGLKVLPWVLREFRRVHPHVGIVLSSMVTRRQVRELLEGRLDCGFLRLPMRSRRLSTQALFREHVVAALPLDHPLSAKQAVQLEDLANEDFIYFASVIGVEFQEHILTYCNRAGFSPRMAFEAEDTASIVALVAAGFGVAIVPEWISGTSNAQVTFKPLRQIPAVVELAAVWLTEDTSPINKAFRDVVSKYVELHPPSEQ